MSPSVHLFVECLTVMDFSYLDTHRGLLGESWLVDVELGGTLNAQGMIFDFSAVKKTIKEWIDRELDHRLLVPGRNPDIELGSAEDAGRVRLCSSTFGELEHFGPAQSVAAIAAAEISCAVVARWMEQRLKPLLPENVTALKIRLSPPENIGAVYQYSHGLAQHAGNCQRIAHGHRSPIQIEIDGVQDHHWEAIWAERWHDIYIGSRQHLCSSENEPQWHFRYAAAQGAFELKLPRQHCYLIDAESTVEHLAQYIATETAREAGTAVSVRAYEGVGKGAIATAG